MSYLKTGIGGAILTLSVILGIYAASSATAQAQYPYGRDGQYRRDRDDDRRGRRGGRDFYRVAQDRGYQDGVNTGSNDASQGKSNDPQRSHYYKNATYGYDSSYGNKDAYRQAYRDGFVRGYEEAYRRNRGYNRGYGRRYPFR